ncbi:SWIM-type domain-containing protein [Trichonephila clavipes]|nr:SWIM-type domain-containing protein [Trichonephila clavipes]
MFREAISPLNAPSQPRPRLSVPIAADRTLQTSRVAPKTPSTPKQQNQKRRKTSGKSATKKKDKYLKYDIPLVGEVKISLLHSHNTTSAETLRMLRVNDEVCQQFYQYFSDGMSPIEAICFHENKFLLEENFMGTTVKVHEDHLWAVLLVTPLMKRNHHLFSSKEIIFIDSTSSEASSSTITILLSATKVGALPLAVMIHASQSIQNYINAFQLLKMNFPQCFGGQDYPEVFMSDDSSAEKGALAAVWPEAKQLLCHFHVAQAEWRWLFRTRCWCKRKNLR